MQRLFSTLIYLLKILSTKNKTRKLENKLCMFCTTHSRMLDYIQLSDTCHDEDRETTINFNGTFDELCMETLYAVDSVASNCIYVHGNTTRTPVFIYKKYKVHVNIVLQNMQIKGDRYRGQLTLYSGFRGDE